MIVVRTKRVILGLILVFSFVFLFCVRDTSALDQSGVYKKALLNALQTCYSDTYTKTETSSVSNGVDDILTESGKGNSDHTGETVVIPNHNLGNTLRNNARLSCWALFNGIDHWREGKADGLFTLFGKSFDANGLGYEEVRYTVRGSNDTATDHCLYYSYRYNDDTQKDEYKITKTGESDKVCFAVDDNGYVVKDEYGYPMKAEEPSEHDFSKVDLYGRLEYINDNSFEIRIQTEAFSYGDDYMTPKKVRCRFLDDENYKFADLKQCLLDYLSDKGNSINISTVNPYTPTVFHVTIDGFYEQEKNNTSTIYSNWYKGGELQIPDSIAEAATKRQRASNAALRYFTDNDKATFYEYKFSEQEKLDIMNYYIELELKSEDNMFSINLDTCYDSVEELGDSYGVLKGGKWCVVENVNTVSDTFNIVMDNNYFFENVSFEELLTRLKAIDSSQINAVDGSIDEDGFVDSDAPVQPTCLNTGAAGSLGWIVCPILSGLSTAANNAYNDFIKPALQVSPQLFTDFGGDTKQAWSVFQGFANILFIILFMVVIFSQLTGVGIDNYGIKKILPKLIVAAILINLSYIICVAFIDVSNIVGNALQSLFDALSEPLGIQPNASINLTQDGIDKSLGATGLTGLALLGIVVVNIWAVVADGGGVEALVLALLVAAIGVVAAIFSLFLVLAAREAAIVVLTIISPLAFACMILPNTKKLFDKWVNAGKALLLLYPICGLLVGGGNYVSKLLLSSGMAAEGFSAAFMAMIIGVVPIFFIPTLTKNSLQALGNIGAKIAGLGKSFGGKMQGNLDKAWKGSQGYKERVEDRSKQEAFMRARRIASGLERKKARNGGNLSENDQLRLSRAYGAIESEADRRNQAHVNSMEEMHEAKMNKQAFDTASSAANTLLYGDNEYLRGKNIEADLQTRGNHDRGVLYTRPGFAASKRSQMDSQIRSEIRKAHSERLSNASKSEKQSAFSNAIHYNNGISHEDAVEQMDAAWDALTSSGDTDQILDTLNRFDLNGVDTDMRDRIMAKAAASGNAALKGWSKAQTIDDNGVLTASTTLSDYVRNGDFSNYLATDAGLNALNSADKETLEYLQNHGGSSLNAGAIANMATSAANNNERSAKAVAGMINEFNAAAVGSAINAEGLTRLSNTMAQAIGASNLQAAINEINKSENATLKAKLDNKVKETLGITD